MQRGVGDAVVAPLHIFPENCRGFDFGLMKYGSVAYCGEGKEHLNEWLWGSEATRYEDERLCADCLAADDYALYLLGEVGEQPETWTGLDFAYEGTITGRLNANKPNYGASLQHDLQSAANKIQQEAALPNSLFISNTDYAALERKLNKK